MPLLGWAQKLDYLKEIANANKLISDKKFDQALNAFTIISDSITTEYDSRNKDVLSCQFMKAYLHFFVNDKKVGYQLMNNFFDSFFIAQKVDKELYKIVDNALFKYFKGNLKDTSFILTYLEKAIPSTRITFGVIDMEYQNNLMEYISMNTSFVRIHPFVEIEIQNWNMKDSNLQKLLNDLYWGIYKKIDNNYWNILEKDFGLHFTLFIDKAFETAEKYHYNDTISAYYLYCKGLQSYKNGDYALSLKQMIEVQKRLERLNYKEGYYRTTIFNILDLLYITKDIESIKYYLPIIEHDFNNYTQPQQDNFCLEKLILIIYKEKNINRIDFVSDSIEKIYGCHINQDISKLISIGTGDYNKFIKLSNTNEDTANKINYKYLLDNFDVLIYRTQNYYYKNDYYKANSIIEDLKNLLSYLDSIKYANTNIVYYDMLFKVNFYDSKIKKYLYPNTKSILYRNLIDNSLKVFYSIPNLPRSYIYETYGWLEVLANNLGLYQKALSYNDTCIYYVDNKLTDDDATGLIKSTLNDTRIELLHKLSKLSDEEYLDYLIKSYNLYDEKFSSLKLSYIPEILDYAYLLKKIDILKKYTIKYITLVKYEVSNQWVFRNISEQEEDLKIWTRNLDDMIYYAKNLKIGPQIVNDIYALKIGLKSLDVGNITYLANYKLTDSNSYNNIKPLQDLSIKYSKMSLSELNNNIITEDSIAELQKNINFQITKLLQQSNKIPFDINKFNLDSIRKYLKKDECYVFHYYESINKDSTKRVKDFTGYRYGFGFNLVNDGIIVESTAEKSPASSVLKPTDRIIQVNDKTISNVKEMSDEVYSSISMNIKIIRDKDTLNYKLKRDSIFEISNYFDDIFVIIDKDNSEPKVLSYLIKPEDDDKKFWGTLYRNYSEGLKKIYDERTFGIIFKPLFDEIKKYKTVYYSLSGDLNNYNIEQVYDTDSKKYLSDEFEFHSCPTLEDYYQIKKPEDVKISNKNIAIFGNPDFTKFSDALSANTNRSAWEDMSYYYSDSISKVSFSNLPYTKYEIDEINKIGKSNGFIPIVYEGKLCSETSIKNLASPFILHVATHGYYFNNSNNTFVNKYSSISNSLLNTGLILTEAKAKTNELNDGFLSAYEVLDLNLNNTELVVLSACETSLASYNYTGSDVNSLQRSFRMAGTKAVLASKWKVPDKQTGELMTEFYTNWLVNKMTKHQALQQAQLTLRKKYPEPYYWAAWVLYGE